MSFINNRIAICLALSLTLAGSVWAAANRAALNRAYETAQYESVIQIGLSLQKRDPQVNFQIGDAFFVLGQAEQAVDYFLQAYTPGQSNQYRYLLLERFLSLYGQESSPFFITRKRFNQVLDKLRKDLTAPGTITDSEFELMLSLFLLGSPDKTVAAELRKRSGLFLSTDNLKKAVALLDHFYGEKTVVSFLVQWKKNRPASYYEVLGDYLWQKGRYEVLIGLYEEAWRSTRNVKFIKRKGLVQIESGKKSEGFATWERLIILLPRRKTAFEKTADIYFENGYNDEALAVLEKGINTGVDVGLKKAYILGVLGRVGEALTIYCDYLIKNKYPAGEFRRRLDSLIKSGVAIRKLAAALENYSNTHANNKEVYRVESLLLYLYLKEGNFDKGAVLAGRIAVSQNDSGLSLILEAERLQDEGMHDVARLFLKEYNNRFGGRKLLAAQYGYLRARSEFAKGEPDNALDILKNLPMRGVSLDRRKVERLRGNIMLAERRYDDALNHYIAAGAFATEQALATALLLRRLKLAESILSSYKGSARPYFSGILDFYQGRYEGARRNFFTGAQSITSKGRNTNCLFFLYIWSREEEILKAGRRLSPETKPNRGRPRSVMEEAAQSGAKLKLLPHVIRMSLGFHPRNKTGISKALGESPHPFIHDHLLYLRAVHSIHAGDLDSAREDLETLQKKGRVAVLKAHTSELLARFNGANMEILKKHAESPYSFFARERLKQKIVP